MVDGLIKVGMGPGWVKPSRSTMRHRRTSTTSAAPPPHLRRKPPLQPGAAKAEQLKQARIHVKVFIHRPIFARRSRFS